MNVEFFQLRALISSFYNFSEELLKLFFYFHFSKMTHENCNSPIISKLRSNKNYKISNIGNLKKKGKKLGDDLSSNDVNSVVNNLCGSLKFVSQEENEVEDFLFNISDETDLIGPIENKTSEIKCLNSLSEMLNNLVLDKDLENKSWRLFNTQKNGFKLFSLGFTYNVDKPKLALIHSADKIYWRCENRTCIGRAISPGLKPPLTMTQEHKGHSENQARLDELISIKNLKEMAVNSNDQPRYLIRKLLLDSSDECVSTMLKKKAMRQLIQRTRNKACLSGFNAKCLTQLEIPEELKFTYRDKAKFYMFDTGNKHPNRIIIFTTENNLKLMANYKEWYADGTFDVSPTLFKQVYSIHININNTNLPVLYGLLPNKKGTTYKKFFKIIHVDLSVPSPNSINCDFELAAINAAKKVFNCGINCCYFHLSQSLYRHIQTKKLLKEWNLDPKLRQNFRRLQALAFIPINDVILGFEFIKSQAPKYLEGLLAYFECNYIGRKKKGIRINPRFPMDLWNVNDRIKLDLPRTNNNVESWHSRLKPDVRQNLCVAKVVELFRQEQNYMESDLVRLFKGEILSRCKTKVAERNENIKRVIMDYKSELLEFYLDGLANIIQEQY